MKVNGYVKVAEDIVIPQYRTIHKGELLRITKFNQRYVYCVDNGVSGVSIKLTYKQVGQKAPKRKPTK